MTLLRCWLIGLLWLGTPGILPAQAESAPSPAAAIKIVIELEDEPAVIIYQAAQRRPWSAAAAVQMSRAQIARIEAKQQNLLAALRPLNALILYRTQRVYNGIAAIVEARHLDAIRRLPGVKAVRPLIPKSLDNWHSVPSIGAAQVWEAAGLTGEGVTIGIIDSGIDYLHADFGGPAAAAAYTANDTLVITDTYQGRPLFPTAKVAGGWDFVGDDYAADGGNPALTASNLPRPDPDPAPCYTHTNTANHGTHVAGTAAGNGVTLAGVIVVAAAGNDGDKYYSVNTPSTAARAISVAGSDDGAVALDGFRVTLPASIPAFPFGLIYLMQRFR